MKVKICGIQDEETAKVVVESGAEFIGFVFAKSKRKVSIEQAKAIATTIPTTVKKVAVCVNPTMEEIETIMNEVGVDYIQLHGDETPAFCRQIPIPVIKAFPIKEQQDIQKVAEYEADYFLFDSPGGKYRGGSGMTFDWEMLRDVNIPREKVIVAGGLHPSNVKAAIQEVNPAIVDVSSGVETDGKKDAKKIKQFIESAKQFTQKER
ncbi:phosphoribosylanthranilate isomerase [Salirhabdus euzebyi]|uniref:N-(5'-phosphoribosyl)anthranilate isomerase n=1 Tax=Salirhabdus euzebyi TaxID=394506 RepID=A0A841QA78_9BACI|nr:phosphoribosylanthranilate isomerase [Salirhabdus euzebyi]MBB6455122.1 phosphoribosylanthranilate isomerase [Salirhabdus euzebyi]